MEIIIGQLIEIIINFFETFLIIYFSSQVLTRKYNNKYLSLLIIILLGSIVSMLNYYFKIKDSVMAYVFLYLLVYIVFIIIYTNKNIKKLLVLLEIFVVLFIAEMIVVVILALITDVKFNMLSEINYYRLAGMILSKTLAYFILKIYLNKEQKQRKLIIKNNYLFGTTTLLLMNIFGFMVIVWLYGNIEVTNNSVRIYLTLLTMVLCVILIISFSLFNKIAVDTEKEAEQKRLIELYKLERKYSMRINETLEDLRILKHDLKNHISCIWGLLETNQILKLKDYLTKLMKQINDEELIIIEGNNFISEFLNCKFDRAKIKSITVNNIIDVKENINIDQTDICQILGNIIDNAIEANEKENKIERYINFKLYIKSNHLVIELYNPVTSQTIKENGRFLTTKKDKINHGLGLKSVRNIVDRYNGFLYADKDNNQFIVKIKLPNIDISK